MWWQGFPLLFHFYFYSILIILGSLDVLNWNVIPPSGTYPTCLYHCNIFQIWSFDFHFKLLLSCNPWVCVEMCTDIDFWTSFLIIWIFKNLSLVVPCQFSKWWSALLFPPISQFCFFQYFNNFLEQGLLHRLQWSIFPLSYLIYIIIRWLL